MPGAVVTLEASDRRWHFYLIGASVPDPADTSAMRGAETTRLAREDPDFIADWVLLLDDG